VNDIVAVVGEALVDFVQPRPEPMFEAFVGGSPANVAVGLARLGVPARLAARIGADPLGRRIRRHLDENGVDLSYAVAATEPSTLAIVAIGEDGSADYDFRVEQRSVANANATCLVTNRKPGHDQDPTLGASATLCLSAEGVPLLVQTPTGSVTAVEYSTTVPDNAFDLPASPTTTTSPPPAGTN